jgi:hypothetical protein
VVRLNLVKVILAQSEGIKPWILVKVNESLLEGKLSSSPKRAGGMFQVPSGFIVNYFSWK